MLDRFFTSGTKIINLARNGRSSKSFIDEARFSHALTVAKEGDFALIQFGHNDEKSADLARFTSPERDGEFRKNLEFFVTEFQKKGVLPLLLTPIARRKFIAENKIESTHAPYAEAIKQTAQKMNVPCVDLTSATETYFACLGEKYTRRFYMNFEGGLYKNFPEGKADDSHLRPDGAFEVCRLFEKELLSLKEKWPSYEQFFKNLICISGDNPDGIDIDDEKSMW